MKSGAVIVAALWLVAASAFAQRVVVRSFEGPSASKVRSAVVQGLTKAGFERVREAELDAAVEQTGADVSTEAGRRAVARKLQLAAFVEGDVKKRGGQKLQARVRVYNGNDGTLLGEASFEGAAANIARHVAKEFNVELGSALERARPPEPEPPPAPPAPEVATPAPAPRQAARRAQEPTAEAEAEAEPERASNAAKLAALELGASVHLLTRSYSYKDPLLALAVHDMSPTPALRLDARWYPGSHFTNGFVANLGLDLHAQLMFPVNATKDGTDFKTTSTAFGVAARLRIPLGEHQLGVLAGYGGQSLGLADAKGMDPGVPSVAYGFVRMGADGRIALPSHFGLDVRAAYLVLTSFGELATSDWFSHASGGGFEAELSLGYSVSRLLAFKLGGGMMRYTLSLSPEPKDAGVTKFGRIAGGVTDQYFYGLAGATLSL